MTSTTVALPVPRKLTGLSLRASALLLSNERTAERFFTSNIPTRTRGEQPASPITSEAAV